MSGRLLYSAAVLLPVAALSSGFARGLTAPAVNPTAAHLGRSFGEFGNGTQNFASFRRRKCVRAFNARHRLDPPLGEVVHLESISSDQCRTQAVGQYDHAVAVRNLATS